MAGFTVPCIVRGHPNRRLRRLSRSEGPQPLAFGCPMQRRRALLLLLTGLFTLLFSSFGSDAPAQAQTPTTAPIGVIATTPADGETLTAAPPEIILNFAAILPDIEAVIQLQNSNRELLNVGQPIAFNNRTSLKVRVLEQNGLPAGGYTVTWLVKPKNSKPVSGKFNFILQAPDGATTGTDSTTDTTEPLKIETGGLGLAKSNYSGGFLGLIGRLLGYLGLAAFAGALIFVALAWAEGVEYVLTVRHLIGAWALGTLGNLISLAAVVADTKGVSLARGLLPTTWGAALDSTYGKVLVIRFLAMAASLWVARRPERVVDSTSRLMAFGGPGLAVITYGWSRHPEGLVSIPFGILHMLGISAWFGGAALITRVVLAGPGEADLVTALKKFRGIALPALGLTVFSGLVEAGLHLGGARNLFNTGYGKIFILKFLAVAAMAFVGTANRQFVRARLSRTRTLPPRPAQRLRKSVRTEILVGAFVLLLTGWLTGAKAPNAASSDPAAVNKNTLVSDDGSFKVEVTFGPKKVGAQVEVHFRLLKPKSLTNGLITFTPNDVNAASIEIPIEGTPRYGFGPDQGFVFPASGTWTITVTGTGPDGDLPAASGQFVVLNQDGSDPTPTSSTIATESTRLTVPDTTEPVDTTPANAGN